MAGCARFLIWIIIRNKALGSQRAEKVKGLILCSKKKILWVESRDLSQTDNSYNSVFFSKVEWWEAELLFLSLNNWGLNFLQNECWFTSSELKNLLKNNSREQKYYFRNIFTSICVIFHHFFLKQKVSRSIRICLLEKF